MYKLFIRKILFLFEPETIHDFLFSVLPKLKFLFPLISILFRPKQGLNEISVNGLLFRNRLGLAAGLDKNGELIELWDALGFSHCEVGTVTPLPQSGNPKPRLFRLVKDEGIINRMGFNNDGAEKIRDRILEARRNISKDFIIGVNIGKNKDTKLEEAHNDYIKCLETLYEAADYFTINISSPNTEGLRELQDEKYLNTLLLEIVMKKNEIYKKKKLPDKNIFVKISPDIKPEETKKIFRSVFEFGFAGIILTNTTISRPDLKTEINEEGGLSGKPLKPISDKILKTFGELKSGQKDFILIGAGGVFNKEGYKDKMLLGADLVQIYTGIIYEGFGIVKKILN